MTITQLEYTCFIPANLDLQALLKAEFPTYTQKDYDHIALFLDFLCRGHIEKGKRRKKGITKRAVPLCAKALQYFTRDYKKYLDFLERAEVIKQVYTGVIGRGCSKYLFCEAYRGKQLNYYNLHDQKLILKIYSRYQDSDAIQMYPELFGHLMKVRVNIGLATTILDEIYGKNDEVGRHLQESLIKRINDPRMATFVIGQTGRLTTTITNLHKKLRSTLRYKGKPLVGLDIKSSIPFFSIAMFLKHVFDGMNLQGLISSINPNMLLTFMNDTLKPNQINKQEHPDILVSEYMMLVEIQKNLDSYPRVVQFIDLIVNGDIYSYIAELWNRTLSTSYTRDTAKTRFLEILNSPPSRPSDEKIILLKEWPEVFTAIDEMNRDMYTTKNGITIKERIVKGQLVPAKTIGKRTTNDPVCLFAHFTQRLEAHVILDIVCRGISKERPDIPLLTIHDSILTTEEHAQYVKDFMEHHIYRVMGRKPTVVLERPWGKTKDITKEQHRA